MTIVIDTVASPPLPAMHAAGVQSVCRYLSKHQSNTTFKRLTQQEADALWADGFGIVPNWEYDAYDWLGGAAGATEDATIAVADAKAMGFPQGAGIALPGSADFDMSASQWSRAGSAYASTWAHILLDNGYVPGVYGSYDTIQWCADLNVGFGMYWQSMSKAFSQGRNAHAHPLTHLWQQYPSINIGGQNVDQNLIMRSPYGACYKGGSVPVPPSSNALVVDGILGTHTVSAWQRRMGTPVDGVITSPWSNPSGTSSLVSANQRYLNSKIGAGLAVDGVGIWQDGHSFFQTTRALQRYLGTTQDGVLSLPTSHAVMELQRRLNAGTY